MAGGIVIGRTLGSYRITRELGEGGMGVVYLAEHPLIGRKAVVKKLRPELCTNREVVERFFNEARAATVIKHAGIVAIFDFGHAEDGTAYIVMEHLEGESLGARIERQGVLGEDEVVRIGRQIASALAAAHEIGVVHRDLKPDNVFIVADGEVAGGERAKILDFGIAKLSVEQGATTKTRTGAMMGSPLYMAPEQCRGAGEVDGRADVYALGCVLYHLACGRPPFLGEGVGEIIGKHIYESPTPPRALNDRISAELEALIVRCLHKDPDKRVASMRHLVAELDGLRGGPERGRHATPVAGTPRLAATVVAGSADGRLAGAALGSQPGPALGSQPGTATAQPIATPPTGLTTTHPPQPRGRRVAVALAGLVLVGGVIAAIVASRGDAGGDGARAAEGAPIEAAPAGAAAPGPATAPAAPATIKLVLRSSPDGAEVYRKLDGVRLGLTPLERELERGDGELVLVLKASGHDDLEVTVPLASDVERSVTLAATTATADVAAAPAAPAIHDATRRRRGDRRRDVKPAGDAEATTKATDGTTDSGKRGRRWGETVDPLAD